MSPGFHFDQAAVPCGSFDLRASSWDAFFDPYPTTSLRAHDSFSVFVRYVKSPNIIQSIIDLLLTSGAEASLKDKEGRTAKDFDYQPPAEDAAADATKMEL